MSTDSLIEKLKNHIRHLEKNPDFDFEAAFPDCASEIPVKYACCRYNDGTHGLFLADENGSHYGQRIATLCGNDHVGDILKILNNHTTKPVSSEQQSKAAMAFLNAIRAEYNEKPITAQSGFSRQEWDYGMNGAKLVLDAAGMKYVD